MIRKYAGEILAFLGLEFLCLFFLNIAHITFLRGVVRNLEIHLASSDSYLYYFSLVTLILSFIFITIFLAMKDNGKINFVLIIILIILLFIVIISMREKSIEAFYWDYFAYILCLSAIWAFISILHRKIVKCD
jgi:hypothetical protein